MATWRQIVTIYFCILDPTKEYRDHLGSRYVTVTEHDPYDTLTVIRHSLDPTQNDRNLYDYAKSA